MSFLKSKNPFKSTLVFGVLSGLKSGISLILLPVFLNYLSPDEYGIISLVIMYSTIIAVIGSMGLKSALYTFYFDFDNDKAIRVYLSHLFSIHLLSFIVLTILHLWFGDTLFNIIFESHRLSFSNYGLIALLSVFFEVLNSLYFVFLKNELNLKLFLKYTMATIVLTAVCQLLLVVHYDLKITGLLMGALIPNVIIFLLISLFNPYLFRIKFEKKLLGPSFNYSLKLLPFLLFFAFENQIDKYLIELNLGLDNVGLYTLLIKIFGILTIALNAVDDGIRPFLYRHLKDGKTSANTYLNLYIGFSVLVLFLINTIGVHLEYIIKNTAYLAIRDYFFLASIVFLLLIPIRFYGLLLVYYKASFKLSMVVSVKVGFLVVLMLFLIPKYQLHGALYALCISNIMNGFIFALLLVKKVKVVPNFKTVIYTVLFIICTFALYDKRLKVIPWFSFAYFILSLACFVLLYRTEGRSLLNQDNK